MSHNQRQQAYKAIAYVFKGGCTQPACRDHTFTDPLNKIVERKQVIAMYTMRCFLRMKPETLWRVCSYMASPKCIVPGF